MLKAKAAELDLPRELYAQAYEPVREERTRFRGAEEAALPLERVEPRGRTFTARLDELSFSLRRGRSPNRDGGVSP
jgi:hypothetical protein